MFLYIVNNLLIMIFFLDHVYTSHLYFVHSQSYLLASGSLRKIRAKMYNTLWYFIKKLKMNLKKSLFSSIQFSHSVVSDSATAWTAARQTSLSITNSRSLPKLMSIESVMPSNHLILCHSLLLLPQSFPASGSFPMSQFFILVGQNIGVSVSVSVLPVNIQDWFPLELIVLISLQSKRLSRIFSNTSVQKHQFFSTQLSLSSNSNIHAWLLEKP